MWKALYRAFVTLHPPAFRRRFGAELLWIFEEQAGTKVALALFSDIVRSLLRQWMLRTQLWIVPIALTSAFLPFVIAVRTPSTTGRGILNTAFSEQEFFFIAVVGSMSAVILTLVFCVTWFQLSRRRRHA